MLSEEQLKAAYNGCKEGGHLGALAAVAEAAVRDERENRNRPMALREFAELVQKLVIIGPLTSEQGRQLMMLQEMASTTLEAAVKDAVGGEPVAWLHNLENFQEPRMRPLDENEISRGWTQKPLYTRPQASAAVPEVSLRIIEWLMNPVNGVTYMLPIGMQADFRAMLATSHPEVKS